MEYSKGKQTLREISLKYKKDLKTIQKYFDLHQPVTGEILALETPIVITLDAFFWSRSCGVLVARGGGKNLLWREIESERLSQYEALLNDLKTARIVPAAFVIDGRRGVRELLKRLFPLVPIQLCQFHAVQTVTHRLTKRPKLAAGKQLRTIILELKYCGQARFTRKLHKWHERWSHFLTEKTPDESRRKWHYTHKKLRSASFGLVRNLPWLFTYLNRKKLDIPNTTNSCDGWFAHLKQRVKIHRGLSCHRRKKMTDFLLENGCS